MADAAVRGHRLGLGMALDCDLPVAGKEAKLQLTEPSAAWAPRSSGRSSVSAAPARSGTRCPRPAAPSAKEAMAANLINRVAPKGQVMEAATQLARDVAANARLSVRATVRPRRWFLDVARRRPASTGADETVLV